MIELKEYLAQFEPLKVLWVCFLVACLLLSLLFFVTIPENEYPVLYGIRFIFGGLGLFIWIIIILAVAYAADGNP